MIMSYAEYLEKTNKEDTKESWIDWKIEICGMGYLEALRASNDPDWGHEE